MTQPGWNLEDAEDVAVLAAAIEAWWNWYEGTPATSMNDTVLGPMREARGVIQAKEIPDEDYFLFLPEPRQ